MSDQPAPLSEEEIARLRQAHAHCAADIDDDYPHSLVCGSDDGACDVLLLLATLDQERTLRQAAETWAARWKRAATLYRSKVGIQQEKIDRQREYAQKMEHSNAGLRGSAKEWRRKAQFAERERDEALHRRQQALSLVDQRNETVTAYARQLAELRVALTEAVRVLHRADSRLGLLLSRGGIQWGFGVGEQQDYSQVIGEIRRTIALLEEMTHV